MLKQSAKRGKQLTSAAEIISSAWGKYANSHSKEMQALNQAEARMEVRTD
jgi:hypothetical protein